MRIRPPLARQFLVASLSCLVVAVCDVASQEAKEAGAPAVAETDAEWVRDAKFGMFIHWGLYSQSGGAWGEERYYGITEWIMKRGKIPAEEYKRLADAFNPVDFDASEWVGLAKDAGVGYIVITAKHHDGFAMFDSYASDFDIVDATPYGKDPLKELVKEARENGIRIGFYYSQYQDWTEKDAAGNDWEFDEGEGDFETYLEEKAMPQLEELLTNYGPIDIIWFDTPGNLSIEDSKQLKQWVKNLQPNTLVSDRIGHDLGDYKGYRDGEIPSAPEEGRPWEAIFTHNDSWGYSKFDNNFKSTLEVLEILVEVAGKGGNLMLNVGPDGRGNIPLQSVETFREVGAWLDMHGEAIYGTEGTAQNVPWGAMTKRPGKLYLHVFKRPEKGRLIVPRFTGKLEGASLLANGEALEAKMQGTDLHVSLPGSLPDSRVNVVVLDYSGDMALEVEPGTIISRQYGPVRLGVEDIDGGTATSQQYSAMHYFGDWKHYHTVGGLSSVGDAAIWKLRVLEPGKYKISLHYSASNAQAGQEGVLAVNGADYYFRVLETGEFDPRVPLMFIDHPVAVADFEEAGEYELSIRPMEVDGDLMKLEYVQVQPHD